MTRTAKLVRRFNYTNRRRIERSDVHIRLREREGIREFEAAFQLDRYDLDPDARLFVEAYHRSTYQRFDFGTVGDIHPPHDRCLDRIASTRPLFRVKAVVQDGALARIVAVAERLVPLDAELDDQEGEPLLPVEFRDLGHHIWELELDGDWPTLILNQSIEGIREAARSSAAFLTLVYPEICRRVLEHALAENAFDPDSGEDDWGTLWLRFGRELAGTPEDDGEAERKDWVARAVEEFAKRKDVPRHFRALSDAEGSR